MPDTPYIITLTLNSEAMQFFDALRQQHFPAERNFLKAHLTLFHHITLGADAIASTLHEVCAKQQTITLQVTDVKHIGNGVAYSLQSSPLISLHKNLQQQWAHCLTPQDKQGLWPHITIQNKVDAQVAKNLQQTLLKKFEPFTVLGTGLQLWAYKNGPWQAIKEFSFNDVR